MTGLLSDKRRKYFAPKDVAEHLGISRSYVYQLINEGKIVANQFGKSLRVSRDEILRYERETRMKDGYLAS